jgi:uncharacterized membrane protein
MSIAAMTDARIQRQRHAEAARPEARPRGVPGAYGAAPRRAITPLPAANAIARYVPTEALAIYVVILAGAFGPLEVRPGQSVSDLDFTGRWIFLAVSLLATAALVWLLYVGKARAEGRPYRDVPVFEMAVAVVALGAWACALPDTPLADFAFYGGWVPPVVLGLTTAAIPAVASALGKTPPVYEEAEPEPAPD